MHCRAILCLCVVFCNLHYVGKMHGTADKSACNLRYEFDQNVEWENSRMFTDDCEAKFPFIF